MALEPVVLEVKQNGILRAACPICDGGTLVTETEFTFQDTTCGDMNGRYQLTVTEERLGFVAETVQVVRIALAPNTGDCRGPAHTREYTLLTEDIKAGQDYILANPSRLKPQSR